MDALKATLVMFFLRCCSLLPLSWARALGRGAVRLYWPFGGRSRRVTERNIELVFPELAAPEQAALARRSLCATGELAAEIMPLEVAGEVVGILAIGSRFPRAFSEEDRDALRRLASQASVALRNARLHASLRALSLTDPLTGLPNRRHLDVHMEREVAAAKRGRELMAVIFDVDYFKTFNDRHGHLAGDQALRAFANILLEENRAMNLVARYGGDEFVSILSDSVDDGADRYIGRVRARLASHPFLANTGLDVTCGVAVFNDGMHRGEDLFRAADQDLYRKKDRRAEPRHG